MILSATPILPATRRVKAAADTSKVRLRELDKLRILMAYREVRERKKARHVSDRP